MASSWYARAAQTTGAGLWDGISHLLKVISTFAWDTGLALLNLITPRKRVIATNWPEFVPPTGTDSRSPCPAINALANHGILPHDGRNITFKQMAAEVNKHFNCSPSLCYTVCDVIARILRRNYSTDSLDLSDMNVHNGIEHDGSLTRHDTVRQPDQSIPDEKLINDIISASKDGKKLTAADFSCLLSARWSHSKRTNGQFSLSAFHASFGAGNAATLLLIFGGDVADIKPFLLEERIPEGWSSKIRSRMGLTMAKFNSSSLNILLGVDPSWKKVKKTA